MESVFKKRNICYRDIVFPSINCVSNGEIPDTLDYRWIFKLEDNKIDEIASRIFFYGDYLWILSKYGWNNLLNELNDRLLDTMEKGRLYTYKNEYQFQDNINYNVLIMLSRFYKKPIICPDDNLKIRIYDIELELYRRYTTEL